MLRLMSQPLNAVAEGEEGLAVLLNVLGNPKDAADNLSEFRKQRDDANTLIKQANDLALEANAKMDAAEAKEADVMERETTLEQEQKDWLAKYNAEAAHQAAITSKLEADEADMTTRLADMQAAEDAFQVRLAEQNTHSAQLDVWEQELTQREADAEKAQAEAQARLDDIRARLG